MRVEVEGGIGVVVQVHVHLVAHLTIQTQVDLLVEVETGGLAVTDGQRGILDILQRGTHLQLCRSLCLDTHTTRTEDLLRRPQVEVHVHQVELVLTLVGHVLFFLGAEEIVTGTFLTPLPILLRSHQNGGIQIGVANLRADDVDIQRVIVFYRLLDIVWQT